VEVWQTSNLRPLRLGEEKKVEEGKIETTGQKYNGLPYYIVAITRPSLSDTARPETRIMTMSDNRCYNVIVNWW